MCPVPGDGTGAGGGIAPRGTRKEQGVTENRSDHSMKGACGTHKDPTPLRKACAGPPALTELDFRVSHMLPVCLPSQLSL